MQVIKKEATLPGYAPLQLPDLHDRAANAKPRLRAAPVAASQPVASLFSPSPFPAQPAMPQEEAAQLIEAAHTQAAQILSEATARASEIERVARETTIQAARAELAAEAAEEATELRMQMANSLAEIAGLREQMATYAEHEMVQLAVEIAKKIVRREVTVDREIVVSLARVALSRLHNRALASVRLHPEDFQYLTAHRDKLSPGGTVKLIEDTSISRGGCLIETDFGDVDARIEQQFSEIERGFLNDLGA